MADESLQNRLGLQFHAACLRHRERFDVVPFFWTEQFGLGIAYVGHAEHWDAAEIDGDLRAANCSITYRRGGRKLAVATIVRDLEGLRAEVEFERTIATGEGGSATDAEAPRTKTVLT